MALPDLIGCLLQELQGIDDARPPPLRDPLQKAFEQSSTRRIELRCHTPTLGGQSKDT